MPPGGHYGQRGLVRALPADDPLFNDPRQAGEGAV